MKKSVYGFYKAKNDLSENTTRICMFLLADYIQQSDTVDYHKIPVFAFIHTTRASIFCKGKQVFFVDKSEITLCKEATVELSIYVKDFPKNLSEEVVKMSEKRA